MQTNIYRWYEEIITLTNTIREHTKQVVIWRDRLRRPELDDSETNLSECNEFLWYFSIHHAALLNATGWSGGDLPELHRVFRVLVNHFQLLEKNIWKDICDLECRFYSIVEY